MGNANALVCGADISVEALLACLMANKPVYVVPSRAEELTDTLKLHGMSVETTAIWEGVSCLSVTDDSKLLFTMQGEGHKLSRTVSYINVIVSEDALKYLLTTDEVVTVSASSRNNVEAVAMAQNPPIHLDIYTCSGKYEIRRTNDARLRKLMGLPV